MAKTVGTENGCLRKSKDESQFQKLAGMSDELDAYQSKKYTTVSSLYNFPWLIYVGLKFSDENSIDTHSHIGATETVETCVEEIGGAQTKIESLERAWRLFVLNSSINQPIIYYEPRRFKSRFFPSARSFVSSSLSHIFLPSSVFRRVRPRNRSAQGWRDTTFVNNGNDFSHGSCGRS